MLLGPNGRLIRISIDRRRQNSPNLPHSVEGKKTKSTSAGEEPRTMREKAAGLDIKEKSEKEIPIQVPPGTILDADTIARLLTRNNNPTEEKRNKREAKKHVSSFIVEEASNCETEDDDSRYVWGNLRPSTGEWAEPVEPF